MAAENVLLVEGNDDWHVCFSLIKHYEVPETFGLPDPKLGGGGGIDNLLLRMEGYLGAASDLKRLGIVVDAEPILNPVGVKSAMFSPSWVIKTFLRHRIPPVRFSTKI